MDAATHKVHAHTKPTSHPNTQNGMLTNSSSASRIHTQPHKYIGFERIAIVHEHAIGKVFVCVTYC